MEAGYVDHRSISGLESLDHERDLSVSMTATIDAAGNLLIGKLLSYGYYIYRYTANREAYIANLHIGDTHAVISFYYFFALL